LADDVTAVENKKSERCGIDGGGVSLLECVKKGAAVCLLVVVSDDDRVVAVVVEVVLNVEAVEEDVGLAVD